MCHTLLFTFLPLPTPNNIMSCCYSNMKWNISLVIQPMSIPNQIREIDDICCWNYATDDHKKIYFLEIKYIEVYLRSFLWLNQPVWTVIKLDKN